MLLKIRYIVRNLPRNTCDKLACMAHISITAREEEASSQTLLIKVSAGHSACNRRLSRASQAAQSEDAALVSSIGPVVYLLEEVDADVGEAGWIMLSLVCVERRVRNDRQTVEHIIQI